MATWIPFIARREAAVLAFKQAIIDSHGRAFPKFKESRLQHKGVIDKLGMGHLWALGKLGRPSDYADIVAHHLVWVYLGYFAHLQPYHEDEMPLATPARNPTHADRNRLHQDGYRELREYHFFAIDYHVDPSALERFFSQHGAAAEYAAFRVAAPAIAGKVLKLGGVAAAPALGAQLHRWGVSAPAAVATAVTSGLTSHDAAEGAVRINPELARRAMRDDMREQLEGVQISSGSGKSGDLTHTLPLVKSHLAANSPVDDAKAISSPLVSQLSTNYVSPEVDTTWGMGLLNWELLAVCQKTMIKVAERQVTCSPLSAIETGPLLGSTKSKQFRSPWSVIAQLLEDFDTRRRWRPIIDSSNMRTYWSRFGEPGELKAYEMERGREADKMHFERGSFLDWFARPQGVASISAIADALIEAGS